MRKGLRDCVVSSSYEQPTFIVPLSYLHVIGRTHFGVISFFSFKDSDLPLTINTGLAPYHEKLYDVVSHILTLTLTKSSIAQTANCFPRLLNLDIVYTMHPLPPKTSTHCPYSLRKRQHYHQLSHVEYSQYKNSFITRCLFNFR